MESKARQLLAGTQLQTQTCIAHKLGCPLTGPAHHGNHALIQPLHIEIGQIAVRGASARSGNSLRGARLECRVKWLVIRRQTRAAGLMVEHEFGGRTSGELRVERQDVGQERWVLTAGVPHVHGPLDGRIIHGTRSPRSGPPVSTWGQRKIPCAPYAERRVCA